MSPPGAGRPGAAASSVSAFGDAAVLITLSSEASLESAARAQALARRIRSAVMQQPGWGAAVPGAASVLVHVDPADPGVDAAVPVLQALASEREPGDDQWPGDSRLVEIPVRYGGDEGPDLDAVAERTGMSAAAVVEAHAAGIYRALFLGFAPGFAYLGPLPDELVVPRRASPRVRLANGSVAIAGPYTAVYPIESSGGWHILGRTSVSLWDPRREPPALLEPGTRVRFVPEAR